VKLHQCSTGRASPLLKPGSRGRPLPTREGLASGVRTVGLQFQSLIETMFTLAAEGKTNRKGPPQPIPARRHRRRPLRHRPAPMPARPPATSRTRDRRTARPSPRIPSPHRASRQHHPTAHTPRPDLRPRPRTATSTAEPPQNASGRCGASQCARLSYRCRSPRPMHLFRRFVGSA
jgi:hypothetical protein